MLYLALTLLALWVSPRLMPPTPGHPHRGTLGFLSIIGYCFGPMQSSHIQLDCHIKVPAENSLFKKYVLIYLVALGLSCGRRAP